MTKLKKSLQITDEKKSIKKKRNFHKFVKMHCLIWLLILMALVANAYSLFDSDSERFAEFAVSFDFFFDKFCGIFVKIWETISLNLAFNFWEMVFLEILCIRM